jgi:hypothetical protein
MSRSGMFCPAVCSLAAVCLVRSSDMQWSVHDSGCRLAAAVMSIHMYQHLLSLARRSSGTMAQLSALLVVRRQARPVNQLAVARPMVRLVARPVYLRRSPAAPGPQCVPAGQSMLLD